MTSSTAKLSSMNPRLPFWCQKWSTPCTSRSAESTSGGATLEREAHMPCLGRDLNVSAGAVRHGREPPVWALMAVCDEGVNELWKEPWWRSPHIGLEGARLSDDFSNVMEHLVVRHQSEACAK